MSEQNGQPKKDELIGKTLGQFEILEEIGRGGMATVYRARQTSINRIVAVKILPRHLLHDPSFFERFEREVDVITHLEHPHILPIYDYGEADGIPYIAMRYLAGGSMAQLIRRTMGAMPLEQLEKPFVQVAQALDYAHQQGIIHRDLKPGNIMMDESGNAYLSDFGIARVLGSNLTGSAIIGTPAYMSPEQANGLPLDARSDIYALGVVLFELITGREPYQAETPMALLLKHINEPLPPIQNFREDVPQAVEKVIAKATAKDPNQRFSSAGDMARSFQDSLHTPSTAPTRKAAATEDPATVVPPLATPPPLASPVQSIPAPITGTATAPAAERRSNTPLIIGGVVALVVVIGVIAVLALGGNAASTPTPTPPPTDVPAQALVPTPFSNAQTITTDLYTVSMPRAWIPPQGFSDMSRDNFMIHMWQDPNLTYFVALAMPTNATISDEASFRAAIDQYDQREISQLENLTLIDEMTFADGSVRRSYRLEGPTGENSPDFPPGQLDVFFLNRAPHFVVLNTYSADSTGNDLVGTFQSILDSLRVAPEEAQG
jgi:serine/threonine protein kinase